MFLAFNAYGKVIVTDGTGSDSALRTDLASPDPGKGGALVFGVREKLTSSRTYYVRVDGSDSNSGLANGAADAFLTIQKAVDTVMNAIDLNGFDVTIQVGDGTYTTATRVTGFWTGSGAVSLAGNTGTPASCVISTTSAGGITVDSTILAVRGFKVQTTTSGDGIVAQNNGLISINGNMEYGACAYSQLAINTGGQIIVSANYGITGGATSHLHAGSAGQIIFGTVTATLSGTPAYSAYFAGAAEGHIIATQATFTGAATGLRYLAHYGSVILGHPGFANAFPGNVAGYADEGGSYSATVATPFQIATRRDSNGSLVMQSWNGATQAYNTHLLMRADPSGTGFGYLYINGDESYLSGRTHLAGDAAVDVTTGSADGITFASKAQLAAGTVIAFSSSTNNVENARMRRRGTDGSIVAFYKSTTNVGSISVTGAATAYNTSSDRRLKTLIEDAPYDAGWINRIAIREYEFISQPGVRVIGPIAQELLDVEPGAVTPGDDNPDAVAGDEGFEAWGVDPGKMVWKLIQEVQHLRARVAELGEEPA
jgi:hypothetical protein